ncbi:MAG: hypothetical protein IPM33_10595 [Phycisphaerales bacterium]|nr:hypothetical protein [Phycisphaerales bacterium]
MTRLTFIWIAAAAVLLLMLGISLPASLAARSQRTAAGLQLTSTARDAEAIRTLKSSMPPESSDEPAGGLTQPHQREPRADGGCPPRRWLASPPRPSRRW